MDSLETMNSPLEIVSNTSTMVEYKNTKQLRVADLITQLHLDNKFYAILVNGSKAELDMVIPLNSEIVILPKLAGG